MILWNAINEYFITHGDKAKGIALAILLLLFALSFFRRFDAVRNWVSAVPKKNWLLAALGIGLLLRVFWVFYSPYSPPAAGTEDYVMIRHARELAHGAGYITTTGVPSADRPIGFALFLAGVFRLVGENLAWIAVINVAFGLLTLWLIFKLGVKVKGSLVGFLAAFLLAIYPTSVFAVPIVLEEHLFIPMWLAGILCLISDCERPDWRKVVAAGLFFGVGAHFRTFSFAMGFVAAAFWILFKKDIRTALLRLLLIQAIIVMIAIPWAIRNYQKLGEPIPYTTWVGATLYFSNNPTSDVRYPINPTPAQGGDLAFSQAQTEIERNRTGKEAALKWIRNNPTIFLQKALGRVVYMLGLTREGWIVKDNFNSIREGRTRPPEKLIGKLNKLDNDFYGVIFLLALFGVFAFLFRRSVREEGQAMWFVLLTLAYYLTVIAITLGHRKYRFAIEPFFCILAAYGIGYLLEPRNFQKLADKGLSKKP